MPDNHLGSIEDFWVARERTKDFAKAEQLALEFAESGTDDQQLPTHD